MALSRHTSIFQPCISGERADDLLCHLKESNLRCCRPLLDDNSPIYSITGINFSSFLWSLLYDGSYFVNVCRKISASKFIPYSIGECDSTGNIPPAARIVQHFLSPECTRQDSNLYWIASQTSISALDYECKYWWRRIELHRPFDCLLHSIRASRTCHAHQHTDHQ